LEDGYGEEREDKFV